MKQRVTIYLEDEVREKLYEHAKSHGDLSKIVENALKQYMEETR